MYQRGNKTKISGKNVNKMEISSLQPLRYSVISGEERKNTVRSVTIRKCKETNGTEI